MLRDTSSITLTPQQARGGRTKRQPITTLCPGDRVIVNLRGSVDDIHQWAGEVVAVDSVAVRLRPSWYRIGLMPSAASGDETVIPWSRIEDVKVPQGESTP